MSKQQTKGYDMANFAHITPATIDKANRVVADRKTRRYSVSTIYKAHNEIFKLREPFQTCDSCLVTRANAVEKWLAWYTAATEAPAPVAPQVPVPPVVDTLSPEENTEVFNALGLTDASTTVDYREAIVAFLADPTQAITDERRLQLTNKVAALDVVIIDEAAASGTVDPASTTEAPKVPAAPIVPAVQPGAGVEVLLQKVNKDDYSKTDGDALYGIFTASADDATKGIIVNKETGKALAAGTYATTDTTKVLGVQPGGKASYKAIA